MQPCKVEPSVEEQYTRGKIPQQLHMSYIEDEFDLTNPIQTKAEFSCAMAVTDKIRGWHEDGRKN